MILKQMYMALLILLTKQITLLQEKLIMFQFLIRMELV